jgi:hypothetical protein
LLATVTRAPRLTAMVAGENLKLLIVTASDALGALRCDDEPVVAGDFAVALLSLPRAVQAPTACTRSVLAMTDRL